MDVDVEFMEDIDSDQSDANSVCSGEGLDIGIEMESDEPNNSVDKKDDEFQYEVLTPDRIMQHMCEIIREVNVVLQLPTTTTRLLLNHFKWDKEKLVEAYYSSNNPDKIFMDAHVVSPFSGKIVRPVATGSIQQATSSSRGYDLRSTQASGTSPTIFTMPSEEFCEICYSSRPSEEMTGLECGHRFCSACWMEYLTTKIMEEGMGQTISCAAHGCGILVDDATVMRLVQDKKVKVRYQHLITNSFVECNRLMRWCPSADCRNAVKVPYCENKPITCTCGCTFCFICGHNWHEPVGCKLLKKWIKKCNDDSETSNWIAANTKECPKCHVTIEKDGGCNHMICKNQSCKIEFCWACLGPWEPHGTAWYHCNRFDDDMAKSARDAQEKSRAALQRYLFYCNRYMNHMQSLKLENKLYSSVKAKMEEMQLHNMSWIEVQFLKKAVDVLSHCRRTLMYTYVFAYYVESSNQVHIFERKNDATLHTIRKIRMKAAEQLAAHTAGWDGKRKHVPRPSAVAKFVSAIQDNQRDLEQATELLSEYLERELTDENLLSIKQKVQDKYRYCESRQKVLIQHCQEGFENDWWTYRD